MSPGLPKLVPSGSCMIVPICDTLADVFNGFVYDIYLLLSLATPPPTTTTTTTTTNLCII